MALICIRTKSCSVKVKIKRICDFFFIILYVFRQKEKTKGQLSLFWMRQVINCTAFEYTHSVIVIILATDNTMNCR